MGTKRIRTNLCTAARAVPAKLAWEPACIIARRLIWTRVPWSARRVSSRTAHYLGGSSSTVGFLRQVGKEKSECLTPDCEGFGIDAGGSWITIHSGFVLH